MSPQEYLEEKRPILLELFRQSRPKPGAPETVQKLAARGLPLAVRYLVRSHLLRSQDESSSLVSPRFRPSCAEATRESTPTSQHLDIFLAAASASGASPGDVHRVRRRRGRCRGSAACWLRRIVALADENIDRSLLAKADHVIDSYAELV